MLHRFFVVYKMPKFKSTQDILRIIGNKDQIRNFGVIAHVDHGKTTMSDSLLAASGIISPSVAGQALALDSMKLEQNRQMTIRGANVTLYYELEGKEYVINMIDTPGHIDFTGRVTRALRAIDGVVVVSDSVEGIMTQTETVTRQALEERVRPVLYINKIDRLVKELRLDAPAMQKWLSNIIAEFNKLVEIYAEPELKEKWKVSIQGNSVAFGSAKDRWGFNYNIAQRNGVGFKDVYDAYNSDDQSLIKALSEKAPLHEAVLGMVVQHHPPPHVAQRYRIPKIWPGDLDSDIGKSLVSCDDKGPILMMVTTINVDPQAGRIATGRLFSGTIKDGDEVYLIDGKRMGKVQSVNIYMGNTREVVNMLPAGNIPALLGIDHAIAGETFSSVKNVPAFESIKYVSEPVVTIAIEPKHPKDLPKLVEALRRITVEDPNLIVKINEETGETLLSGMGVLHLEIATSLILETGLEITTTQPLINYRETIRNIAGPIMSKSPNKHNKIFMRVEPLGEEIIELIKNGQIHEDLERKQMAKILREKGWSADEAKNVAAVDISGNILVDETKGVQFIQESMDSIRSGFDDVIHSGPIAHETVRGVKFILHHFVPHEDPAHRGLAQLMPATRRSMLASMLLADSALLEPILGMEIKCPQEQIGTVAGILSGKRGKLLNVEQKGVISIIQGEVPASETFDLSEVMRGGTAGKALWNTYFKTWQFVPQSIFKSLVNDLRKRKGLNPEPPTADEFVDKE
jgi:elongation factor 2